MGNVAITFVVVPEGPEVDLKAVAVKIKAALPVRDIKEEPIGFGLKQLKVMIIVPDKEGSNTDAMEAKISAVKGVSSVRTESVTLV